MPCDQKPRESHSSVLCIPHRSCERLKNVDALTIDHNQRPLAELTADISRATALPQDF